MLNKLEVVKEIGNERYEYMTVDLSAEPSFNVHVKLDRYIAKLNEYGKQGWRLISGLMIGNIQFLSEKLRIRKNNQS